MLCILLGLPSVLSVLCETVGNEGHTMLEEISTSEHLFFATHLGPCFHIFSTPFHPYKISPSCLHLVLALSE